MRSSTKRRRTAFPSAPGPVAAAAALALVCAAAVTLRRLLAPAASPGGGDEAAGFGGGATAEFGVPRRIFQVALTGEGGGDGDGDGDGAGSAAAHAAFAAFAAGRDLVAARRALESLNAGWAYSLVGDAEAAALLREHYPEWRPLYARLGASPHGGRWRADLVRYLLLHRHGGAYIDVDLRPLAPFEELLRCAARAARAGEGEGEGTGAQAQAQAQAQAVGQSSAAPAASGAPRRGAVFALSGLNRRRRAAVGSGGGAGGGGAGGGQGQPEVASGIILSAPRNPVFPALVARMQQTAGVSDVAANTRTAFAALAAAAEPEALEPFRLYAGSAEGEEEAAAAFPFALLAEVPSGGGGSVGGGGGGGARAFVIACAEGRLVARSNGHGDWPPPRGGAGGAGAGEGARSSAGT